MIRPLFDASGKYFGFLADDEVHGRDGRLVGSRQGRAIVDQRGRQIGELQGQTVLSVGKKKLARRFWNKTVEATN